MMYLVCRVDAIEGNIKSSELFPTLVDVQGEFNPERIVLEALRKKWPNYTPKKYSYYVVPMEDAHVVRFQPRQDYDVFIDRFYD